MTARLVFFGISAKVASKWIPILWKQLELDGIKKKKEKELNEINDIICIDPVELVKYYVEPECQEINPADRYIEDHLVSREPIMKKIDQFLMAKRFEDGSSQLFILSDAGMGKTSLLAMLKLMHLIAFCPKEKECVLKKLDKGAIKSIKKLKNKRNTILLLDSLDEDPRAIGRAKDRLLDILQETKPFFKVIISCRTQFFPKNVEDDPFNRPGVVRIEGFICPAKYLSFFNDDKVIEYCENRFPKKWDIFTNNGEIEKEKAREVIEKMGTLRCRPMLLAYIEALMDFPFLKQDDNEYHVYNALIQSWLKRENTIMGISDKNLLHACIILATVMQMNNVRKISETNLNNLISTISEVRPVMEIDMKGYSLLNRNSEGDYRFSHYSIQEFCVTKLLLDDNPVMKPNKTIYVTDFIFRMLMCSEKSINFVSSLDFGGAERKKNSLDMEFVLILPGTFMMGSPEAEENRSADECQHETTLTKVFYMQTTPVTQGQWVEIMGYNPSNLKNGGKDCPVENIYWDDAQEFIKKLNEREKIDKYRLPSEAEWEYACRAGSQTAYCFGNDTRQLSEYAWHDANLEGMTHPVAQKKPNAWGLYDMHGNVWEWCQDWYKNNYTDNAVTDPHGPQEGTSRVLRGGSWGNSDRDCRAAYRYRVRPGYRNHYLGFRVVCLPGQRPVEPGR
ncbi:SUMF1/EgtB/PvdO family nonheme iron enzyme [Desulfobacterales bacterium HSG16]|nr:SUMF1/EgtB/PvdO family nonheme iron enzyme [Desulfobacterales bacterium HSG16]